jgi:thiol-disulfide isomerase/thioredoxin
MSLAILFTSLALSVVFGLAGVGKFVDLRGTREAIVNFGVPEQFAGAARLILPTFELAIAIGLLLPVLRWWGALGALLLLTLFIVAISNQLRRGEAHNCHCFGQLYSKPLGWTTLIRNLVFAAGAGFVLWQQPAHADLAAAGVEGWFGRPLISGAAWLLVTASAVTVLLSARRKKSTEALSAPVVPRGLPIDSLAPSFELEAYHGGRESLTGLLGRGRPLFLIFSNPKCGPCAALFLEVGKWQQAHRNAATIVIVSEGSIKDNFVNVARNQLDHVLLQEKREIAEQYQANVTPTAVIVRPDGSIASAVAAGAAEIRTLLDSVVKHDELGAGSELLTTTGAAWKQSAG